MRYTKISIICGPNKIKVTEQDGELCIYIGDYANEVLVPYTEYEILDGYTRFELLDTPTLGSIKDDNV